MMMANDGDDGDDSDDDGDHDGEDDDGEGSGARREQTVCRAYFKHMKGERSSSSTHEGVAWRQCVEAPGALH